MKEDPRTKKQEPNKLKTSNLLLRPRSDQHPVSSIQYPASNNYSVLNDFAGFANAAFID